MPDIKSTIIKFYETSKNPNHRFKSWEHCYGFFSDRNIIDDDKLREHACLHLAFYLASWGMLRGSTALLSKDYKAHQPVVSIILDKKYDCLHSANYGTIRKEKDLLFDLINKIRIQYNEILHESKDEFSASDTLITKVLLGTLGCIPAYDRFFIAGIRNTHLSYSTLNPKNFEYIITWLSNNEKQLLEVQKEINDQQKNKKCIEYPIMKIADMYFWEVGRKLLDENNRKKLQLN